jgi:bacterioferritin (cytochrome b1)
MSKEALVKMLNQALELEHSANIQYLSHAQIVDGLDSEPIIGRLKEIAGDEAKHAELFRELIGSYLGGVPSMGIAETHPVMKGIAEAHPAMKVREILETNLADERHAVDVYSGILDKVKAMKDELKYEYFQIEHTLRHVIQDEQEHIAEIKTLLAL